MLRLKNKKWPQARYVCSFLKDDSKAARLMYLVAIIGKPLTCLEKLCLSLVMRPAQPTNFFNWLRDIIKMCRSRLRCREMLLTKDGWCSLDSTLSISWEQQETRMLGVVVLFNTFTPQKRLFILELLDFQQD